MQVKADMFGFKKGCGIVRRYKNAQKSCGMTAAVGLINFTFAAENATKKQLLPTLIITYCTFKMVKLFEESLNHLAKIRPQYKEIVARAKQIKKASK